MRMLSTPSRRIRTRTGRSPLLRTNCAIHPRVPERGTASLLNVRTWSPGYPCDGGGRRFGNRKHGRLCPAERKRLVGERAVFSRQALNSPCFQSDLRGRSIVERVSVGGADAERDTVKTAAVGKVVADLLDLLVAALGFDSLGCQWRQFRNRPAGCANKAAGQ